MTIIKPLALDSWINKKIVIFLVILIVTITVIEIWVVNRLATYGSQISQLEKTKANLTLRTWVLSDEIAKQSSLFSVENNAKNLGFIKIKNIEYLKDNGLALNFGN